MIHLVLAFARRFGGRLVATATGCWLRKTQQPGTRPLARWKGRSSTAARLAYELAKGAIPIGHVIDHRCRNRGCLNPSHLEAVTDSVNTIRIRHPVVPPETSPPLATIEELDLLALSDRFWQYVEREPTGCWLWTGARIHSGYGSFRLSRPPRTVVAHRLSWEMDHGPIPMGLWVLHHCDVRACVRPAHLFLGTNLDNVRDCTLKGRRSAKLNPDVIRHTFVVIALGSAIEAQSQRLLVSMSGQ